MSIYSLPAVLLIPNHLVGLSVTFPIGMQKKSPSRLACVRTSASHAFCSATCPVIRLHGSTVLGFADSALPHLESSRPRLTDFYRHQGLRICRSRRLRRTFLH